MKRSVSYKLILRFVLSILVGIVVFSYSKKLYFLDHPLFGIAHMAEFLIAIIFVVPIFIYLPIISLQLSKWFDNLVLKAVTKVVTNFWKMQSERIREARKIREKEFAEKKAQKESLDVKRYGVSSPVILDTSAIIDGRILEVFRNGFLEAFVFVPSFVVMELQHIADSEDFLRRQRGRRGLDVLNEIKKLKKNSFRVLDIKPRESVDKELANLARKIKGRLVTVDFNLNKAAKVTGVKILNVNDLANSLKTVVLPGELLKIKVIQTGKEENQGVGYLEDGTMVVVENGRTLIGNGEVSVQVQRILQTAAGKMIFCSSPH